MRITVRDGVSSPRGRLGRWLGRRAAAGVFWGVFGGVFWGVFWGVFLAAGWVFGGGVAHAQSLVVDGVDQTLGGVHEYDSVQVINGGRILVPAYDGSDRVSTGNLQIVASSIFVDQTSAIVAVGSGYQPVNCDNGAGPNGEAGGRGGCAVRDSGGGGAHFGRGGRGTKDCSLSGCNFPSDWEEDCGYRSGGSCVDTGGGCYDDDGLPSVAGLPYKHSIYEIEFGAAGGDAGCRDGDGWGCVLGGAGGGRIVLAAVNATGTGTLEIHGTVSADGFRGCGGPGPGENDSAGGGAGGSVLLAADSVLIGDTARVSAAGGLGGDTQGHADCPSCAQWGGTCDDCGGGGGGGIVSVLSGEPAQFGTLAVFDVSGALGGTCGICQGEAGGGAGELQLDGVYVGEYCDGFDNDFDGQIDEGLGTESCGTGACESIVDACDLATNEPVDCVPQSVPSCMDPLGDDTRARFLVIVDTSGSMLTDLDGVPTFGDGSAEHPGLDTDGNGLADDSRLSQAKDALSSVISGYTEIDYALARFAQHTGQDVSGMLAHWVECKDLCCSYDDPTDNSGPVSCTLSAGALGSIDVRPESTGEENVNYVGWCGGARRGADILVGFGADLNQHLMWLDHQELAFSDDTTRGNYCRYDLGNDCELRGSGPTPLAGALHAAKAYLAESIALDPIAGCRNYGVILLTDGTETCMGDPPAAAGELLADLGIPTYVVGFSVLAEEQASLNSIASAGGTGSAFFADDADELSTAMASVVAQSIVYEVCNGQDDDCDTEVDEDFPLLGQACDDGELGPCLGTGTYQCRADGSGVECVITDPGAAPEDETCNGIDDDCDGQIDEGLTCTAVCEPDPPERCNGVDDDCDGVVDEEDPMLGEPCGETQGQIDGVGQCVPGHIVCAGGELICVGGTPPSDEVCNGLDDDCDGEVDEMAECPEESVCIEGNCRWPCGDGEFPCPGGFTCREYEIEGESGWYCVPSPCMECEENESCINDECVDLCEDVVCEEWEECVYGECRDCHTLGCPEGEVCHGSRCREDPCAAAECEPTEVCVDGECRSRCWESECPPGETCREGECRPDPCAELTCPDGKLCVEGSCEQDPCEQPMCPKGDVCVWPGECIDDPCALVTCPGESSCETDPFGTPRCVGGSPVTEPPTTELLLTGSGGQACECRAVGLGSGLGSGSGSGLGSGSGPGPSRSSSMPRTLLLFLIILAGAGAVRRWL